MRPGTASSHRRSRLGSQRRAGCPVKASTCVQTSRSAASMVISSQIWFGRRRERQVGQAGVIEVADAILGAGALTVPDFQTRDRPAAGVGGKAG